MDIIFLAAIALFIFFRLKDQLGKISDEEKDSIMQKIKLQQQQKIQEIQKAKEQSSQKDSFLENNILEKNNKENSQNLIDENHIKDLNENSKENLNRILTKLDIDSEFFIDGAGKAFEMTLEAFSKNDLETLELLLSEKLLEGFKKSIKERKEENKTLNTEIISIADNKIIAASIDENIAHITVEFVTKQINFITDEKGEVVQGSKEQINDLKDIWTFKKDLNDISPNWKVSTTG